MGRLKKDSRAKDLFLVDPQDDLSRKATAVLGPKDLIYIRMRNRQQPYKFLNIRYFGDPYLDREEVMLWVRIFLGRRALDPTTSPLIYEWLLVGLQVIQRSQNPIWFLPYCYMPSTPEFRWILNSCPDCPAKQKLDLMGCWSHTQIRNETSPALRVVEPVCFDPYFQSLCGNDNIEDLLR